MKINIIRSKEFGGILDQKTYVLEKDDGVIIIDAGASVADLKNVIQGKKVFAVLLTHLHFDHICCLGEYLNEWSDLTVFIVKGFEDKFLDSKKNCSFIFNENLTIDVPQKNIKYYAEKLKIADFEIDVIFTPGHSADCVCLLIDKMLFCGDLVLGGSIGRCDLYDSDISQMWDSLEKLESIDFEWAFPGHYEKMTKNEVLKSF